MRSAGFFLSTIGRGREEGAKQEQERALVRPKTTLNLPCPAWDTHSIPGCLKSWFFCPFLADLKPKTHLGARGEFGVSECALSPGCCFIPVLVSRETSTRRFGRLGAPFLTPQVLQERVQG